MTPIVMSTYVGYNHTISRSMVKGDYHMSNEKTPGCLVYIGDYTTQLYGGYNKFCYKDLRISSKQPYNEK